MKELIKTLEDGITITREDRLQGVVYTTRKNGIFGRDFWSLEAAKTSLTGNETRTQKTGRLDR